MRINEDVFQDSDGNNLLFVGIRNIQQEEIPDLSTFFNLDTWSRTPPVRMAALKRHDMAVQAHLFWNQGVEEVLERHPDMRNVDRYSGHNCSLSLCVESPRTRSAIEQSLRELPILRQPEESSCLYALLSAEDEYMCYCQTSRQMFAEWLKEEYGSPDALNRMWGTRLQSFQQVQPPHLTRPYAGAGQPGGLGGLAAI